MTKFRGLCGQKALRRSFRTMSCPLHGNVLGWDKKHSISQRSSWTLADRTVGRSELPSGRWFHSPPPPTYRRTHGSNRHVGGREGKGGLTSTKNSCELQIRRPDLQRAVHCLTGSEGDERMQHRLISTDSVHPSERHLRSVKTAIQFTYVTFHFFCNTHGPNEIDGK